MAYRRNRSRRATLLAASGAAVALLAAGPGWGVSAHAAVRAAASSCPWVGSTSSVSTRVSEVMAQITESQEIQLVTGVSGPYVGNIAAIPSLCLPALGLEDGPAGVADNLTGVTQLPSPMDLAATWDTGLAQQYGTVVGAEERGKGAAVNLGPTVNLVRDPRWGRAFESYGEDPYLSGQMAVGDITGVQSQGVMAQVKHYAVYNQETYRNTSADNAIVDDRVIHELYLPQFQAAIQQGQAASVMCSYAMINGSFACENSYLDKVLDGTWGFPGFITSDWGATHSTVASANAGLDMEMPSAQYYGSALQNAISSGQVSKTTLDGMVQRILTEEFQHGIIDNPPTGTTGANVSTSADVAAAQQIAEAGTVLLKNAGPVLPLSTATTRSIAVIGDDAGSSAISAGGGSAHVNPSSSVVTPLQGIQARAGSGVTVQYAGSSNQSQAVSIAKSSNVAIVFAGYNEAEGADLSGIDLSGSDNSLISAVAAANPHTIVVLDTGSAVTMPWLGSVAGVIEAWYPGQTDGNAVAAVLFGDADPSGKLPVSFPTSLSTGPTATQAQWPGTNNQVQYSEGLLTGYRWYTTKSVAPLFPFGFGLSYTTFAFSNLTAPSAPASDGTVTVTATLTNTGTVAGSDVAQLYLAYPSGAGEPAEQLRGFQKVALAPGASQTVSFTLTPSQLSTFSTASNQWVEPSGTFHVMVGDSSASLPLTAAFSVAGGTGDTQPPSAPTGLTASAVTSTGATLSWQPSTDNVGVTGYTVDRVDGGGGVLTPVGTTNGSTTSFALTGLTPSTAYSYTVTAGDAAGNTSPQATPVSFTTSAASNGGGGCKVAYAIQNSWPGGFQAQVTVTNTGSQTVNGWQLAWTFPAGQQVSSMWNATSAQSGANVTATNASYDATIAPGANVQIGFTGTGPATPAPTAFTLNAAACTTG